MLSANLCKNDFKGGKTPSLQLTVAQAVLNYPFILLEICFVWQKKKLVHND